MRKLIAMAILMAGLAGCHRKCEEKVAEYQGRMAKTLSDDRGWMQEVQFLRDEADRLESLNRTQAARIAELEEQVRVLKDCR